MQLHHICVCVCDKYVHKSMLLSGIQKRSEGKGEEVIHVCRYAALLPLSQGAVIQRKLVLYKQVLHLKLDIKYLKRRGHAFENDMYCIF